MDISKTKQGAYQKLDKEAIDNLLTPTIEYVGEKTTDELVMDALVKHPMAVFQLARELQMPPQTIDNAVHRLWNRGILTRKDVVIRLDGRRRNVVEYRIVKK